MPNDPSSAPFQSILAPLMDRFLQEKNACGYQYHEPSRILRCLDDFLFREGLRNCELPRTIAQKWLAKRTHESPRTHQQRIMVVRQFSRFLCRLGYSAYVPDSTLAPREPSSFTPRILTHEETRKLLQAVDALEPTARSPLRHLIMPEVFRLLYGCGFRLGEVLNLRVRDTDLNQGIVTVHQGKFRKDRLVPLALSLVHRLRKYAARFENCPLDAIFFPAPDAGPYSLRTVYGLFRKLLLQCGIAHAGRGKGPRVHEDLAEILAQPDLRNPGGRRDAVLLSILYDTGARVQELIDLSAGDVRLDPPAQVRLIGKGRKMRAVPLMQTTVQLLRDHMHENHLDRPEQFDRPLFRNGCDQRLSRSGIRYILQKHVRKARCKRAGLNRTVTPHMLRHTKGMHLLQSGITPEMIRDFLGHVDVKTTQIYARANLEMKRNALERITDSSPVQAIPSWQQNKNLLEWLRSL